MLGLVKFTVVHHKDHKTDNCDVLTKDEVKSSCYARSSSSRFRASESYGDKK